MIGFVYKVFLYVRMFGVGLDAFFLSFSYMYVVVYSLVLVCWFCVLRVCFSMFGVFICLF